MVGLSEIVKVCIGKENILVTAFFDELIERGRLEAFSVGKQGKPEPVRDIREDVHYVIQDSESGANYTFFANSEGGAFTTDGDQTITHYCYINRINSLLGINSICGWLHEHQGLPKQMVVAQLRESYAPHYHAGSEIDYIDSVSKQLTIEGKKDKLFEDFCNFIRGE